MKVELSEQLRGVFEKLIPHYEKCIQELPLGDDERDDFLCINRIACGICFASNNILNISIGKEMHSISLFLKLGYYWFRYSYCESYEDAKELLQLRVDAMKSLLKNGTIN